MKYNFISGSGQPAPLPSPPLPTRDLLGIEGCREAVVVRLVRGGRGCCGETWEGLWDGRHMFFSLRVTRTC
jgi:hypothetical protein